MYKDPKVKVQKDEGMRSGMRFAFGVMLLLAVIEVVAVYLYF